MLPFKLSYVVVVFYSKTKVELILAVTIFTVALYGASRLVLSPIVSQTAAWSFLWWVL